MIVTSKVMVATAVTITHDWNTNNALHENASRRLAVCQYPRQSRGLDCVSRSKRLERGR